MTDAKSLTHGFVEALRQSPFRIAPERAQTLMQQSERSVWTFDFSEGSVNFRAFPQCKHVEGTYAALLSLWAVAAAARSLQVLTRAASTGGDEQVAIEPGGPGSDSVELKNAAMALIHNPNSAWPTTLLNPNPEADPSSESGLINNLFLGAASFVILHECGHLVHDHQEYTSLLHEQEYEADGWAVSWMLDGDITVEHREFRVLAIGIAFIWIGLIDKVRQARSTHPTGAQRLGKAFEKFINLSKDSIALELCSYVIKVFFLPTTRHPPADHAEDAFVRCLMDFTRCR